MNPILTAGALLGAGLMVIGTVQTIRESKKGRKYKFTIKPVNGENYERIVVARNVLDAVDELNATLEPGEDYSFEGQVR